MALHYDWHWRAVQKTRSLSVILITALVTSLLPSPDASASPAALDDIVDRTPAQRICTMSPEEYRQIEPLLRHEQLAGNVSIIALADASTSQPAPTGRPTGTNPPPTTVTNAVTSAVSGAATNKIHPPYHERPRPATVSVPPHHAQPPPPPDPRACNASFDLLAQLGSPGWGDSDAAVVIFIVIGVTVVAAVIVYAGAFLYEAVVGGGNHSYWWDIEAHSSAVIESGDTGHLSGIKLSSGFENRRARVGLVVEGGYLDVSVLPDDAPPPDTQAERPPGGTEPPPVMGGPESIDVAGAFAMAGAGVRWPFGNDGWNSHFFSLELLAGGVSDDEVDLMSTARADLSFAVGKNTRVGASLGALYLQLDTGDGLIEDFDSFSTLIGLHAGFRF